MAGGDQPQNQNSRRQQNASDPASTGESQPPVHIMGDVRVYPLPGTERGVIIVESGIFYDPDGREAGDRIYPPDPAAQDRAREPAAEAGIRVTVPFPLNGGR